MSVTSATSTVTPTSGAELDVATITGSFDKVSVYVRGGISISGGVQYRLYAVVSTVRTLIAQSIAQGTIAASILEWQSVGCGTCAAQTQIVVSGGEAYVLTVATTQGGTLHTAITATLAGVSSSDTAPAASDAASLTVQPAQEAFLATLGGYAEDMDVAIDQKRLPSVFVTVYADCGAGSVRAMLRQTPLAGSDETISSVFRALELPVASSYYVSLTNNGPNAVTKTLTACTYSGEPGGAGTLTGDVIGPTNANTVVKWENVALDAVTMAAPTDAQLPVFDLATQKWRSISLSGGATIDHDGTVTINASVLTLAGDTVGPIGTNIVEGWRQIPLDPTTMAAPADATLPVYNIGTNSWHAVAMSGDVTLTNAGATSVGKIHGATVPAAGALTTGNILQVTGGSALSYAPVNLAGGVNFVTGLLPIGNQAAQAMGGDVTGTTAVSVVAKINGASAPAAGALTTGNILQVTGGSALSYAPVNLAGGVNFVTGLLPDGNQAAQTMSGDVTGTTGASVVAKLNGTSVAATPAALAILQATGTTTSAWVDPAQSPTTIPFSVMPTHKIQYFSGQSVLNTGVVAAGLHFWGFGAAPTISGTTASPANGTTSRLAGTKRITYSGNAASTRMGVFDGAYINAGVPQNGVWRGNAANRGGFVFRSRFAISSIPVSATLHAMIGLVGSSGFTTATNWVTDTTIAKLGMAFTCTTTAGGAFPAANWQIIEGSTAAVTPHDLGANFALTLNDLLEVILYCQPNASSVSYVVNNLTTLQTTSGTLNTTLPANTTFLTMLINFFIDTTFTSGTATIDVVNAYCEWYDG